MFRGTLCTIHCRSLPLTENFFEVSDDKIKLQKITTAIQTPDQLPD